jgi:hypothetical protein
MKNVQFEASEKLVGQVGNVEFKVEKRGRPVGSGVNPESKRQRRLAELNAKRENGEVKRGRPVDSESKRQLRIAELEAKRATGELRRGRPKGSGTKTANIETVEVVVAE